MTERILIAKRTVSNSPRKEEGMGIESSPCIRMVMVGGWRPTVSCGWITIAPVRRPGEPRWKKVEIGCATCRYDASVKYVAA